MARCLHIVAATALSAMLACTLAGCGGGAEAMPSVDDVVNAAAQAGEAVGNAAKGAAEGAAGAVGLNTSKHDAGTTSGAAFAAAGSVSSPNPAASSGDPIIDASTANQGFVSAAYVSDARLKFQVKQGEMSYNYDLPQDGSPIVVPVNMGNGSYQFRIMQNTGESNYAEVYSVGADVALESEFAPYLRPNMFCNYTDSSACVAKAREIVGGAANEGDALAAVCTYVMDHVTYDGAKAAELSTATGYVPNPDSTLSSGKGICFDYASLGAAMLRSQGLPTKVMTGNVSPDEVYHSWIMVYIDGTWKSAEFSVDQNTWSRVDLTFGAAGAGGFVGDGKSYSDRYVY